MAVKDITGKNLSLSGKVICFFNKKAMPWSEQKWALEICGKFVSFDKFPVSSQISEMIRASEAKGEKDLVAQIHIDPEYATMLFLEGVITSTSLKQATERVDDRIRIPNVVIDDCIYTVYVFKDMTNGVSIADNNGVVID